MVNKKQLEKAVRKELEGRRNELEVMLRDKQRELERAQQEYQAKIQQLNVEIIELQGALKYLNIRGDEDEGK